VTTNEPSDIELVRRFVEAGDGDAAAALWRSGLPQVLRSLGRRTKDDALVNDAASISFYKAAKTYDAQQMPLFRDWWRFIARQILSDILNKELKRYKRETTLEEIAEPAGPVSVEDQVITSVAFEEFRESLTNEEVELLRARSSGASLNDLGSAAGASGSTISRTLSDLRRRAGIEAHPPGGFFRENGQGERGRP
jgi:DNA-directed RNA polymerase specialized sigma24 family protein